MPVLEVVVRPRVFPDIRPDKADIAVADNPGAGRGVISGGGGQVIDLQYSYNADVQKQHQSEEYRVYDIIRIFRFVPTNGEPPVSPGGNQPPLPQAGRVDRTVYIDQEVMWQVIHVLHTGETRRTFYRRPSSDDYPNGNMEVVAADIIRKTKGPDNLVDLIIP